MSIFNPTLLPVVVNQYTKFEVSILNGCGDIFDKKSGEKEKGTNTRKNKYENAHLQSHNTTCHCEYLYQIWSLNGCGDIFDENSGETEKRTNIGKNK